MSTQIALPDIEGQPDPYAAADPVTLCEPVERPGVVAFRRWVMDALGGKDLGIVRACEGDKPTSKHNEGRAWDWRPPDRGSASVLLDVLLKPAGGYDHAGVRRAGIRVIIWQRQIWTAGTRKWAPYSGKSPHTDHIHFGFSWAGARAQTSLYVLDEKGQAMVSDAREDNYLAAVGDGALTLLAVPGLEHTNGAFRAALVQMCERIKANPDDMVAVMSFESAATFSPSMRNPASGAVGLIQFTKGTAARLGTTTAELATLSALEQLAYVERYFQPAAGRIGNVRDLYLAVFAPAGMGKADDFVLYSAPAASYTQNAKLDTNSDGTITVREAVARVVAIKAAAEQRERLPVGGQSIVKLVVIGGALAAGAYRLIKDKA